MISKVKDYSKKLCFFLLTTFSCFKELAKRTKEGIPIEDEDGDRFDEAEAFKKRREHFQKTKSRSEHKSILIRVRSISIKVKIIT